MCVFARVPGMQRFLKIPKGWPVRRQRKLTPRSYNIKRPCLILFGLTEFVCNNLYTTTKTFLDNSGGNSARNKSCNRVA